MRPCASGHPAVRIQPAVHDVLVLQRVAMTIWHTQRGIEAEQRGQAPYPRARVFVLTAANERARQCQRIEHGVGKMVDRLAEVAAAEVRQIHGVPCHPRMPDRVGGQRWQRARLAPVCRDLEKAHQSGRCMHEKECVVRHAGKIFPTIALPERKQARREILQLRTIAGLPDVPQHAYFDDQVHGVFQGCQDVVDDRNLRRQIPVRQAGNPHAQATWL